MPPAPSGATISYLPSSTRPTSGSAAKVGEEASAPSRPAVGTDSSGESARPCRAVRAPQCVQNCAPARKGWWHWGQFMQSAECRVQSDELKSKLSSIHHSALCTHHSFFLSRHAGLKLALSTLDGVHDARGLLLVGGDGGDVLALDRRQRGVRVVGVGLVPVEAREILLEPLVPEDLAVA